MVPHSGPMLKPKQRKDGTWYAVDWSTNDANEYFRQRAALLSKFVTEQPATRLNTGARGAASVMRTKISQCAVR